MSNTTVNIADHQAHRKLMEVALAMSALRDLDSLLDQILREAKDLTRSDGGTVYLAEDDSTLKFALLKNDTLKLHQIAEPGSEINLPDVPLNKASGEMNLSNVAAAAANLGQTIVIDDVYVNEAYDFQGTRIFDQMLDYRSVSFLAVPLRNYQGDCIGVLQLLNARKHDGEVTRYDLSQIPLVESFASLASVAIQHRMLMDSSEDRINVAISELHKTKKALESIETIDSVTGLRRRGYFDEVLVNEWRRARRQRHDLSLCILEIDRFDQIALNKGPSFAEACLVTVANELGQFFKRPSDFFACFDVGSFGVILPYMTTVEAFEQIDRLREEILSRPFIAGGEKVRVTISSGVATLGAFEKDNLSDLIQLASASLIRSKESGGNITHQHEP